MTEGVGPVSVTTGLVLCCFMGWRALTPIRLKSMRRTICVSHGIGSIVGIMVFLFTIGIVSLDVSYFSVAIYCLGLVAVLSLMIGYLMALREDQSNKGSN